MVGHDSTRVPIWTISKRGNNQHLTAVSLPEYIGLQHVVGRSICYYSVVDHHQAITPGSSKLHVMRRHKYRAALSSNSHKEFANCLLGTRIDTIERFIEQQEPPTLGEGTRKEYALLLPTESWLICRSMKPDIPTRSRASATICLSLAPGKRNHPSAAVRPIITTSDTVTGKSQLTASRWGT